MGLVKRTARGEWAAIHVNQGQGQVRHHSCFTSELLSLVVAVEVVGGTALRRSIKLIKKWRKGKRGYHESGVILSEVQRDGVDIKWVASHPKTRGSVDEFDDEELGIYLADRVADKDYHHLFTVNGTLDVICEHMPLHLVTRKSMYDIVEEGFFSG